MGTIFLVTKLKFMFITLIKTCMSYAASAPSYLISVCPFNLYVKFIIHEQLDRTSVLSVVVVFSYFGC